MTRNGALAGMVLGAATVLFWIYAPVLEGGAALTTIIYEMVPGFLLCGAAAIIVSLLDKAPPENVVRTFEASDAQRQAARS